MSDVRVDTYGSTGSRHQQAAMNKDMSTDRKSGVGVPEDLKSIVTDQLGERLPLAQEYVELLAKEGIEWGLIGPRETDRLWDRHIVNSLAVSSLIHKGLFVADLGSGAGLPGLVLAIARPDLYIDLVEPMSRRCDFLNLCVSRLELEETVNVVRCRVEDYQPNPDILTCRALANLSSLVDMTSRFIPPATLLAIKGDRAGIEVQTAKSLLSSHRLKANIIQPQSVGYTLGTVVRVESTR